MKCSNCFEMFTTIHKERSKKKTAKLPLQSTLVLTYVLTLARRKNHLNSKHVFARFAWSKFLLQVLVFRKGSKRKDSPKWKLGTFFPRSGWQRSWISASWIFGGCGRRTAEEFKAANVSRMYHLQFKFAHVWRPRTAWLINCNHLIGSSSHQF